MRLRKKRGKVKGFEVKKGEINYTPNYMIEKKKQDEFERAYKVDTNALYNSGVVKVTKRRGEEYNPRSMEHLKKPLSAKAKLRKKRRQERRSIRKNKDLSARQKRMAIKESRKQQKDNVRGVKKEAPLSRKNCKYKK